MPIFEQLAKLPLGVAGHTPCYHKPGLVSTTASQHMKRDSPAEPGTATTLLLLADTRGDRQTTRRCQLAPLAAPPDARTRIQVRVAFIVLRVVHDKSPPQALGRTIGHPGI
jgi:hypothetical protein